MRPLSESVAVVFMVLGMFSSVNSCWAAMAPVSSHSIMPWSLTTKSVTVGLALVVEVCDNVAFRCFDLLDVVGSVLRVGEGYDAVLVGGHLLVEGALVVPDVELGTCYCLLRSSASIFLIEGVVGSSVTASSWSYNATSCPAYSSVTVFSAMSSA